MALLAGLGLVQAEAFDRRELDARHVLPTASPRQHLLRCLRALEASPVLVGILQDALLVLHRGHDP